MVDFSSALDDAPITHDTLIGFGCHGDIGRWYKLQLQVITTYAGHRYQLVQLLDALCHITLIIDIKRFLCTSGHTF